MSQAICAGHVPRDVSAEVPESAVLLPGTVGQVLFSTSGYAWIVWAWQFGSCVASVS